MLPATFSFSDGTVSPMPTFPSDLILTLSVPEDVKASSPPALPTP